SFDLNCRETIPVQANHTALRGTPILFGAGLIEAIPASVLIDRANNQPPGLVGRVHYKIPLETPGGVRAVGRYGWKGGIPTVESFSLDAALNEMGLTSQFLPNENAPNGDVALLAACDTVPDPEDMPDADGFTFTNRLTHFQRYLAAPAQTPKDGMSGEEVFESIGCADCHVGRYTTGIAPEDALTGKVVRPYSDFLLHDVGGLADGFIEGQATETEMMTRPLWGLAQRGAFLHDGRATGGTFETNVESAIAEHGGTALPSAQAYQALTQADKDLVLRFLASLGRAEFDWDVNNTIDEFDWFFLEPLLTGPDPATPVTPDDDGAVCDVDQDGDFDLVEFGKLQRVWTGQ
ncbi:MAG: di-heme oxidoredictase family protein, partial [Planctomycetota bacterium]